MITSGHARRSRSGNGATRFSDWRRSPRRASRRSGFPTPCGFFSRTFSAPWTAASCAPRTLRRWHDGTPRQSRAARSRSPQAACSSKTSPASPRSWTWPRCATRWRRWVGIRSESIRSSPRSWSSITRCKWTNTALARRSSSTRRRSSSGIGSDTSSSAGGNGHFRTFASSRPPPGSCIRSIWSTSRGSCSRPEAIGLRPTPTRSSAPIPTRR